MKCFGQRQPGGGIVCLEGGQSLQKKASIFLHFSWWMLMKHFYCVNSSPITFLGSGKCLIMKPTWGQSHNYSCHHSLLPSLDTLDHNLQSQKYLQG